MRGQCNSRCLDYTWPRGIYKSKGPARTATLLKRLIRHNIKDDDVQNNLNKYVDTVDKLAEMDTEINADLLIIMLLYSLPSSFENFRVAIESRDSLPKPDDLKVNIIEEYEARKANYEDSSQVNEGTLLSKRKFHSKPNISIKKTIFDLPKMNVIFHRKWNLDATTVISLIIRLVTVKLRHLLWKKGLSTGSLQPDLKQNMLWMFNIDLTLVKKYRGV